MSGMLHMLKLAAKEKDELLLIEWEAESAEAARKYVEEGGIVIGKVVSGAEESAAKEIRLLNHDETVENQKDANANLTYDPETKKAALVISFTDEQEFDTQWQITTEKLSNVLLYDLEPMPEFVGEPEIDVENENGHMTVTLQGTKLDQFDSISFVAVETQENIKVVKLAEIGGNAETKQKSNTRRGSKIVKKEAIAVQATESNAILLYKVQKEDRPESFADGQEISISFDLPVDLQSGGYELRIVADDRNCLYHSEAVGNFAYTNPNQPAMPETLAVAYGGDYRLKISVPAPEQEFGGYRVTVYDESGEAVQGVSGVLFTADGEPVVYQEDGALAPAAGEKAATAELTVGGQYQFQLEDSEEEEGEEIQILGLKAGETYQVGVSTWSQLQKEDRSFLLYSGELRSAPISMEGKVETAISFRVDEKAVDVTTQRTNQSDDVISFTTPTYGRNSLKITVSADQSISGTWKLDGGTKEGCSGSISQKAEKTLSFTDLEEGVHTLEIMGRNGHGDTVSATYVFGVDTLAPRLLLSSPISGSFYDHTDGTVKVEGITDNNVWMTIRDAATGEVYVEDQPVETDQEGRFEKIVKLDTELAVHTLEVAVRDALGNQEEKTVELNSDALGSIRELRVYTGKEDITNSSVVSGGKYPLALMALLDDGNSIELNDATLVDWRQNIVEGEAVLVQENGKYYLETDQESRGMVTVRFLVSDLGSVSTSFVYRPDSEEKVDFSSEDIGIVIDSKEVSDEIETEYEYTGEEIRPEFQVFYKDTELTEGKDYVVQFLNNINVSSETEKASICIKGLGKYTGSRTIYFRIVEPEPTATVSPEPEVTESPKPAETESPKPEVTESPKPTATESPKPEVTESPEPTETESPKPEVTESPKPGATGTPKPGTTGTPKPGTTGNSESGATGTPKPGTTGTPKPGAAGNPESGATGTPKPGAAENPESGATETPKPEPTASPKPELQEEHLSETETPDSELAETSSLNTEKAKSTAIYWYIALVLAITGAAAIMLIIFLKKKKKEDEDTE